MSSTGRIEQVRAANARLVPLMLKAGFGALGVGGLGVSVCLFGVFVVPAGFAAFAMLLVAGLFALVASVGAVILIALGLHLLWTAYLVRSYGKTSAGE